MGWFSILSTVPWPEVIANAPRLAEGAKKLWQTLARKSGSASEATDVDAPHATPEQRIALLEAQLAEHAAARSELAAQLLESSELVSALAEQNAELVRRVDSLQQRTRWLAIGLAGCAIIAATALAFALAR